MTVDELISLIEIFFLAIFLFLDAGNSNMKQIETVDYCFHKEPLSGYSDSLQWKG